MVRVKICGVTSTTEAQLAERHGAHAIGVLVGRTHASPDFIEPELANAISRSLPPYITAVLVTHVEEPDALVRLAGAVSCSVVQLHSDLEAATLRELRTLLSPRKIIGKVSVEAEAAVERAREIGPLVDAIVLDTRDRATDRVGGTGMVHDWSISARIVAGSKVPIILAGGLTPENVAQAIRAVRPWGVDVNSGVESGDGRKEGRRSHTALHRGRTLSVLGSMGTTTEIRREIKQRFIPFALERGFVLDQKHAPTFLEFRRQTGEVAHLFDVQWEKYGRPRFVVNFGTCPIEGLRVQEKTIPVAEVMASWVPDRGRLQPRKGTSSSAWFRQDRPLLVRLVSSMKVVPAFQVVDRLLALFPELEDYWANGRVGPHMTIWQR